jgi:hydroxymethylglutaryl-CoA synthase
MSTLEALTRDTKNVEGQSICVFAYGSGSKSKVFGATLQAGWREVALGFDLELRLDHREAIDYATYERLHRGTLKENVAQSDGGSFFLADVHDDRNETEGVRHYGYSSFAGLVTT